MTPRKIEVRGEMIISRCVSVSCCKCSRHIDRLSRENWRNDRDVVTFLKEHSWRKTKDGWMCRICTEFEDENCFLRIPRPKYI